jgi:hypothetical protein
MGRGAWAAVLTTAIATIRAMSTSEEELSEDFFDPFALFVEHRQEAILPYNPDVLRAIQERGCLP